MLEQASILTTRHITNQALSLTSALALSRLNKQGPIRLTTLAAAEGIAQPSMTQLIQRLERQRLARTLGGRWWTTDAGTAATDWPSCSRASRQRTRRR